MRDTEFKKRYAALNPAQKQSVDTIDGPVMVIAGPGTGKTELLGMRVANILRHTDTLAESILCLTFTESGATAMRERLIGLIGQDAHKVAIHTFHSFGSEVIGRYSDYFYQAAQFRPADELSSYHILADIFKKMVHDNPLVSKMNDEFTQLKSVQNTISDFKRAGLTPDEIQRVVKHNNGFIEFAQPKLREFLASGVKPILKTKISGLYDALSGYTTTPTEVPNIAPLSQVFLAQLSQVVEAVEQSKKTAAITAWHRQWLTKNKNDEFVFKATAGGQKLLAASLVYAQYLSAMQAAALYDYDDMILGPVHALEVNDELKFNLQEQYQYLLVDEFQDTNGAQMRLLTNLTDNPVHSSRPNIMVVGDDDQAIYSFQGAEVSNMLKFYQQFEKPLVVSLHKNYRSSPLILKHASQVARLGVNRLEQLIPDLDKSLVPTKTDRGARVELFHTDSEAQQYAAIAQEISHKWSNKAAPDIAVLARNHRDIQKILPYFLHFKVPVHYEHQHNVLDEPPIAALLDLARLVLWIASGQFNKADAALAELLAQPAWKCPPQDVWKISLAAYNNNTSWLEAMQTAGGHFKNIANWLVETAQLSLHGELETTIDRLYGITSHSSSKQFVSPLADYFFSSKALETNPTVAFENIESLRYLRQLLREYQPEKNLTLKDLVTFVDKVQAAKLRLNLTHHSDGGTKAVHLMTAHKAKGLEFDSVYIINTTDATWGSKSRARLNRLVYPDNLAIAPATGQHEDERLRLFFVAMTRAKNELVLSYGEHDDAGKSSLRADFLETTAWQATENSSKAPPLQLEPLALARVDWQTQHTQVQKPSLKTVLTPLLESYKLSPTHLTHFLDVTRGGPQRFLVENLLRFPTTASPQQALGTALHRTLKNTLDHLRRHKQAKPLEDVLYDFETILHTMRLSPADHTYQLQKGSDALSAYLAARYHSLKPTHIAERNFGSQHIVVDGVRLTGTVDLICPDVATKTLILRDYKTGKPANSWKASTDYEKSKLHRYSQQLLFYKLLTEQSRDFRGFTAGKGVIEFIEPDSQGDILRLEIDYSHENMTVFKKLLSAVWRRIIHADFPDTSGYEQNYKGVLEFEKDLLES